MAKSRKKTLKVGVIGVGGISHLHLGAYQKNEQAELVAIADISEANLASVGEQYDIPEAGRFTDYKKMVKMKGLDAVSICTPNWLHAPVAIAALKAGKHVLTEKPMAMNAVEGQKMIDAAKAKNLKLHVGHNHRFDAESVFAKELITSGKLGDIYYARVQAVRRRGCPSWGVFGQLDKQGGGAMSDIGVHMIDLTMHLMGHPKPVSVSGGSYRTIGNKPGHVGMFGVTDHKTYTVEDMAVGFVRFDNGATMMIETSFNANLNEDKFGTHLVGDKGGVQVYPLVVQMELNGHLTDCTPQYVSAHPMPYPAAGGCHHKSIYGFVDAVLTGKPTPIPGDQVILTLKIIDGLYASAKAGKEVAVK